MQNTQYGTEKQSNREFVFNVIKKHIRKNRQANVLSFPAEQGLKGIKGKSLSFEGLASKHSKHWTLIGLEANQNYYKNVIKKLAKKVADKITVLQVSDHVYFKRHITPLDALWLDYFGGTSSKNLSTLHIAFRNQVFNDNSVLAITICDTPRTINCRSVKALYRKSKDGTLENGHFNWVKDCAKIYGYKVSLIETFEYRNTDVSSKANTMKTIAYRIEKV